MNRERERVCEERQREGEKESEWSSLDQFPPIIFKSYFVIQHHMKSKHQAFYTFEMMLSPDN